uniref:VEFS-Box domain-containing protein n=1 Tax=Angiostrongylus cantonensis TaxID=6313 RepID=A0A0K0D8T7_ANGCA
METNRPVSQVKEYYDRFFIRGPIGQLALKLLNWEETKRTMIADGSLRYQCEVDRITYMLLVVDALKESKERLDPKDDNLTTVVEKIVRDYVNRLDVDTRQQPQCGKECEPSEINDVVLTDDSCDPSDGEMDRNKPPEDAYSTGLEPENDSDEDDSNTMSLSRAVKVVILSYIFNWMLKLVITYSPAVERVK